MKQSAGILLYKYADELLFFLVHPGGPFWRNKDAGAWSIPKGEFSDDEEALAAAVREFGEETGIELPEAGFAQLSPVRLKSGKKVLAWALEHDVNPDAVVSNTFPLEWPPRSGKTIHVPEIDKAAWFRADEALVKINEAQRAFILQVLDAAAD